VFRKYRCHPVERSGSIPLTNGSGPTEPQHCVQHLFVDIYAILYVKFELLCSRSNNRPTLNASLAGLVESAGFLEYVDAVLLGIETPQYSFLKGQCHEIFDLRFFHESVSPKPLSIPVPYVLFRIFSKILGDICRSRCTTSVVDTGGKC
jgi:hypothetical protein